MADLWTIGSCLWSCATDLATLEASHSQTFWMSVTAR